MVHSCCFVERFLLILVNEEIAFVGFAVVLLRLISILHVSDALFCRWGMRCPVDLAASMRIESAW